MRKKFEWTKKKDVVAEMTEDLLTYTEAAKILNWEIKTIHNKVSRGTMSYVQVGGKRMLKRSDVEKELVYVKTADNSDLGKGRTHSFKHKKV